MSELLAEVPVDPATARVYAEGWQSWSPAGWYAVGATGPAPEEAWQHLMRFRPGTRVAGAGLQAEGLLVVEPGTGEPARLYGAPDNVDVPIIHAALVDGVVVIRSPGPVEEGTGPDGATVLAAYADALDGSPSAPPRVWCSWYRY